MHDDRNSQLKIYPVGLLCQKLSAGIQWGLWKPWFPRSHLVVDSSWFVGRECSWNGMKVNRFFQKARQGLTVPHRSNQDFCSSSFSLNFQSHSLVIGCLFLLCLSHNQWDFFVITRCFFRSFSLAFWLQVRWMRRKMTAGHLLHLLSERIYLYGGANVSDY